MKKKIIKYSLIVIIFIVIINVFFIVLNYINTKRENTQYPYSEITIRNNQYYHKEKLVTGKSYILGNDSDSISLTIKNGKLNYKNTYRNGNKEIEEYYIDGIIFSKTFYKNGKKDGIEEYYNNGILNSKTTFKNDIREGLEEHYKENGFITQKTMNENDKIIYTENYSEEDGLISKWIYENGELYSIEYYKNGELYHTSIHKKGVKIEDNSTNKSYNQNIGGVYTFESGYRRMKITISSEKWFGWLEDGSGDGNYSGKTTIGGKMNGSDLYDEYGSEKRGYVSGNTIYYNDPLGEIKLSK
jgi:antitoxin component YwqK of YwqJK toxin-antitoxin module